MLSENAESVAVPLAVIGDERASVPPISSFSGHHNQNRNVFRCDQLAKLSLELLAKGDDEKRGDSEAKPMDKMFLVHFTYIDPILNCDRQFSAYCNAVPRVGELIFGPSGSGESTIVNHVGYRFHKENPGDTSFVQTIHVALGERGVDWADHQAQK